MELNDAVALLTTYNEWRRGEDKALEMPNPREIGVALDTVLAAVNEGGTLDEARMRSFWRAAIKERDEWREQLERERDEAQAAFVIATDQLVVAQQQVREMSGDDARAAATWAVQWLDTVIDRLENEATIKELFEDMAKVRETNSVLDHEWNRCGWTGIQAARFLSNLRKEEE